MRHIFKSLKVNFKKHSPTYQLVINSRLGRVVKYWDTTIAVIGGQAMFGGLVKIYYQKGHSALGLVIKLRSASYVVSILDNVKYIKVGQYVKPLKQVPNLYLTNNIIGNLINPLGKVVTKSSNSGNLFFMLFILFYYLQLI